MKGAHQVLAGPKVDPHLAAHGTIDLRQQGGGHLDEIDSPQVSGGHETGEITHDAAAQGHHEGTTFQPVRRQLIVAPGNHSQIFRAFAGRHGHEQRLDPGSAQGLECGVAVKRRHVRIGQDRAALSEPQLAAVFAQPGQQSRPRVNGITAAAQRHLDSAHAHSIEIGAVLSKGQSPPTKRQTFNVQRPTSNVQRPTSNVP